MKYVEAFKALGYDIESPRQDWSAESQDGVCLSLWQKEIRGKNGTLWLDTELHGEPLTMWGAKPGNRKRKQHLARAVNEFFGAIDVIIVFEKRSGSVSDAFPWRIDEKKARWFITSYDADTGHFKAETRSIQEKAVV